MLETNRLILRQFDERDIDVVYDMRRDPEVMRFIRRPQSRAETINWLKLISSRWTDERIGFCAVIERSSNKFIGWCGLWRLKETGEIEVGYAVVKEFRGNGFAAEAAGRCLRYGFEELKVERIVSVARPENTASRRVMEKLGMRYDYTGEFYGRPLVHYAITAKEFLTSRSSTADAGGGRRP